MIKLINNSKRDFCLLNLTDPQLKAEEWEQGNRTGDIFKKTVETLIERVSPDLITLSGDLSYAGDFESYKNFADYFDSLKIPWACCFGNHDNQDGADFIGKVLSEYKKHTFFLFEECEPSLGNGNYVILIEKNGKNAEGVILMDTHDRVPYVRDECGKNLAWAGLTKEQLAWYGERIAELEKIGCRDTTLITHIPINAYLAAAEAAFKVARPDKSLTLADSYGADLWNPGYEDSYGVFHEPISAYPEDEGAFDLICKLGSTKNIVCGHNHINNWVVKYNGVRFIFGTKTGIGSYFEPEINGGTVISVKENGVTSVRHEYVDIQDLCGE
ncbi:MAG: metallophosphoesterase [Clostridia bacterium]|nr:metallophosphoesterase [Clostridia bacterium]